MARLRRWFAMAVLLALAGLAAGVVALDARVRSYIAGPALGGFLAEKLHWSAIFSINLPLGLLAFWMTNSLLKKLPRHEKPHRLDFLGAGLMIMSTTALLLALSLGGPHYAWTSPTILALLAVFFVFAVAFMARLRTAPEPLIPIEILANPLVAMAIVSACACSLGIRARPSVGPGISPRPPGRSAPAPGERRTPG